MPPPRSQAPLMGRHGTDLFGLHLQHHGVRVPVGLLTDIGNSLDMRATDVGVVMTIYAWTVAVATLPLTMFVREVERRVLLMRVFVMFILSHVVTGFAPNFDILVLGRIGIAFAHAVFWSISIPLVVRLVPPEGERCALAMMSIGTSIAMVAGVPIGRAIGDVLGWRATFQIIACAGVLGMAVLWLTAAASARRRHRIAAKCDEAPEDTDAGRAVRSDCPHGLRALFGVTYLEPFAHLVTRASNDQITFLLVLFGAAGIPAAFCFQPLLHEAPVAIPSVDRGHADRMPAALALCAISRHFVDPLAVLGTWQSSALALPCRLTC